MNPFSNPFLTSLLSFIFALFAVWISLRPRKKEKFKPHESVKRHPNNPVMSPLSHNFWEEAGVFNPAAVQDDTGRVHVLYRALGSDGVSRIGYASSKDGMHFDERLSYPVYAMQNPRENTKIDDLKPDYKLFPSGGSWGGAEDPRLVKIDDTIYLSFNAFYGWDFVRIGVVPIKASDFYAKRWKWGKLMFISPENEVNKNWVIFPEKINGKFAILHSITPEIQIDYVDRLQDLDFGLRKIKSKFGQKKGRKEWDTFIRGAGPPPLRTDRGWLVLYHAMDKNDPHIGYKLGALLLDLKDPQKVIARSPGPVLVPSEWYENDWKPGVVYACGATIKDGTLYVYYGGGDKHVCVAHAPINVLVDWLINHGKTN